MLVLAHFARTGRWTSHGSRSIPHPIFLPMTIRKDLVVIHVRPSYPALPAKALLGWGTNACGAATLDMMFPLVRANTTWRSIFVGPGYHPSSSQVLWM